MLSGIFVKQKGLRANEKDLSHAAGGADAGGVRHLLCVVHAAGDPFQIKVFVQEQIRFSSKGGSALGFPLPFSGKV